MVAIPKEKDYFEMYTYFFIMNMNLEQVNSGYLIPQAPEVEKNVLSAFFSDKDAFEKT